MCYFVSMSGLLRNPNLPPPNLFTPDFGQAPHMIVGRDDLLRSMKEGLGAGPRDSRFITLLLGARSAGKTVMLNTMSEVAKESGWIVFAVDASTDGITDRIAEQIEWIQQSDMDFPVVSGDRSESRTSTKIKLPALEWQREVVEQVQPRWSLQRQLRTLAEHASQHDSAVLLIVDEMHGGDRKELRRLAADLQHVTKAENLPLAFLGAGLSEMRHTLLEDKRMTFFHRCHREAMPPLTSVDAARFLRRTVNDAGGSFSGEALQRLSYSAGSLPFRLQLLGHYAWLAADAPHHPIDDDAAWSAIQATDTAMYEKVASHTWNTLNSNEQAFMRTVASFDGTASPQQIAQHLEVSPSTLARLETRLENAGCVVVTSDGLVRLGDVVTLTDMTRILGRERRFGTGDGKMPARSSGVRSRCNSWMPRAQARCVLPMGHAGGHRSR